MPPDAIPAIDVLDSIRDASDISRAKRGRVVLPDVYKIAFEQMNLAAITPLSRPQAQQRIRLLVPLLARNDNKKTWGLLASHVPGWSGRECYDRWVAMGRVPAVSTDASHGEEKDKRVVATILRTLK